MTDYKTHNSSYEDTAEEIDVVNDNADDSEGM